MPESDARALLNADDDADICISYLSTAAGEVRFQPERVVPLHRLVRRASVATAAGLSLALAACAPHGDGPRIEDTSEAERPAFLEFEPAIPTAEPCETQPPPEVAPEVAPYDEIAPKADPRVRGRLVRAPEPEKLRRLGGAPRRVEPPKREKL